MSCLINVVKTCGEMHKHETYEIITVFDGEGNYKFMDKKVPIKKGNIIIIPPGVMHQAESDGDFLRMYLNGKISWLFNYTTPKILLDNESAEGQTLARLIYANRYESVEYLNSLCTAYMHYIIKNIKMEDDVGLAVSNIVNEIIQNFNDLNFNLAFMLVKSGYAEDYIRSHFKKITGKTPVEFLTNVRINHARHLISMYKDTVTMQNIAYSCGYDDYAYFSRKFKMVTGVSPKEYQRRS